MPATAQDVKIAALAAPPVAMVITALRMFERIRTHKVGVDDAFALFSAIQLLVFVVGMVVRLDHPHLIQTTEIGLYYTLSLFFYGVLWCARLSILFSIVRITPGLRLRRILYGLAALFCLCWAILFAQDFWTCENEPGWKEIAPPQCVLGTKVGITQLITDVFADSCLIAIPVKLLWNIRVSKGHRIRLLLIFSTSITTTIVSLAHAYYLLRVGKFDELVAAIVENSVSLIVCNTAVIVTTAMRLTGLGGEDDSPTGQESYASGSILFARGSKLPNTINTVEISTVSSVTTKVGDDEEVTHDPPKPPLPCWPSQEGVHLTQELLVHFTPAQKPE